MNLADAGATFGVWNADLPGAPLKVTQDQLVGGKAFASGAGLLTHALVTLHAGDTENVQLLLIDLQATPPLIDTSWWATIGMRESETHLVRWDGPAFQESWMIGRPGDYETEPAFSGGAIRFCAAQAGAIASLFDLVKNHLVETDRCEAPHQSARLAGLYSCAALSAGIVRETACNKEDQIADIYLAAVAHARTVVTEQAERAIMLAQQSVGVASMFRDHPLARTMSDLMVYLRQPAPDAQRHKVGQAASAGLLVPDL
ncbi:acyl-CoA dehydrogenase [Hyphomonas oceanitis]|uniref:acyl-CoA dehydrogenase n=1 Tax=Hyphomonas oceanitis TaxID=81033 RepID=UPI003001D81E